MTTLRDYQAKAVADTVAHWRAGVRSVLIVAPTGAGKTVIAADMIRRLHGGGKRVLFVAHRRELVRQTIETLGRVVPIHDISGIGPGLTYSPMSPITVATIQSLLQRSGTVPVDAIVLDEAHHYVADDWSTLTAAYPDARILGVTATPERTDGRPLGDMFDQLVETVGYTRLIDDGHLVPCRVYQPAGALAGGSLAQSPVTAYQRHGGGGRAFCYVGSVGYAKALADEFTAAGIPASYITAGTSGADRDSRLSRFRDGALRVLVNVYTLTEGVDVPAASVCIIASTCSHVTGYLQRAGRVLRPHPGKTHGVLIDLVGASLMHGLPTEDRVYSLDGDGIRRLAPLPIKQCPMCGLSDAGVPRVCPSCGYEYPVSARPAPVIHDEELRAVYDGANTPKPAKRRELKRLLSIDRPRAVAAARLAYIDLFDEAPDLSRVDKKTKKKEYMELLNYARARRHNVGSAAWEYKRTFGVWPRRLRE